MNEYTREFLSEAIIELECLKKTNPKKAPSLLREYLQASPTEADGTYFCIKFIVAYNQLFQGLSKKSILEISDWNSCYKIRGDVFVEVFCVLEKEESEDMAYNLLFSKFFEFHYLDGRPSEAFNDYYTHILKAWMINPKTYIHTINAFKFLYKKTDPRYFEYLFRRTLEEECEYELLAGIRDALYVYESEKTVSSVLQELHIETN